MLHRKLVEPALARLDRESATYFTRLADHLATDPRVEDVSNLVFLLFRETIPYLPTYLSFDDLSDRLIGFVKQNRGAFDRAVFDRGFVADPAGPKEVRKLAKAFVHMIVEETMQRYEDGAIDGGERKAYRFSWPYDNRDFPYVDED